MISPLVTLAASKIEEAKRLEDPSRKEGPSVYEARERAEKLRSEAEKLLSDAFYQSFKASGS